MVDSQRGLQCFKICTIDRLKCSDSYCYDLVRITIYDTQENDLTIKTLRLYKQWYYKLKFGDKKSLTKVLITAGNDYTLELISSYRLILWHKNV